MLQPANYRCGVLHTVNWDSADTIDTLGLLNFALWYYGFHAPSLHPGRDKHSNTIVVPKQTIGLDYLTQWKTLALLHWLNRITQINK